MKQGSEPQKMIFGGHSNDPREEALMPYYHVDLASLVLTIYDGKGREVYEISLGRCCDSAQILDWIYQLKNKTWCTPEILAGVVFGIERAVRQRFGTSVQSCICSGGEDHAVDWHKGRSVLNDRRMEVNQ